MTTDKMEQSLKIISKNIDELKKYKKNDVINVKIIELDAEKKRISLSYKETLDNPWDSFLKKFPTGSTVKSKVTNIADFGLFVVLEGSELVAMIHKNDISWAQSEANLSKFKKNDIVKAKILEIDKDKEKIRLGIKQLEKDPFDYFKDKKNGEVITVKVQSVMKNAIKVSPGNEEKLEITLKKNQLGKDGRVDVYSVGNRIDCMIVDLELDKRKVNLSIKELEIQNEKRDIKKFGKDGSKSGAVLGDILGKVFSSKKEKKK